MNTKSYIKVQTFTWSKDSHGLFDYESNHLSTGKFKLTDTCKFFRNQNEIQTVEGENTVEDANGDRLIYLFDIKKHTTQPDKYYLSVRNSKNLPHSLGLVVRGIKKDNRPAGYELKVGDHIKIGRVKFIVREMRDTEGRVNKMNTAQQINYITNSQMQDEAEALHSKICRICLLEEISLDPIENTLVTPCKCKGSCEFVHLKCLKQWIDSKKSKVENSNSVCLSFNYKKLSCEICKETLPYSIKLDDREFEIVEIKKPENIPYIILEKIETAKENKGLFLVKSADKEIRNGRGHTNKILV
jgi:hypothetical protein